MAESRLTFDILARDRASDVFRGVGRNADTLNTKLATIGAGVARAFGTVAVAGVAGLGAAFANGLKDAATYETLAAKTDAVLKSTGNSAGTTGDRIRGLAGELENLSGVDEELIINSQNVLATFTQIRNSGTDRIFDQAAKAALNMSTALGTDLRGATIQVGKALNDPIAGLTSLTRAGVQFTDAQKEQIRALVEAGDVMGAQKVILGELETQFGGAAAAAGQGLNGSLARLKDAFGDAFRDLATAALPTLTNLAQVLAEKIPVAIEFGRQAFATLADAFETVRPTLERLVELVRDNLEPVLAAVAVVAGAVLYGALVALGTAVAALLSPAVAIVAGLAAVAAALVYAYQESEVFRAAIDAVVQFVTGTVVPAIQAFVDAVIAKFGELVAWTQQHWGAVQEAISHVVNVVEGIIRTFVDVVQALWRAWGDTILSVVQTAWGLVQTTIANAIAVVQGVIAAALAIINGDWSAAWEAVKGVIDAVWSQMTSVISAAVQTAKDVIGGLLGTVQQVFNGIRDVITDVAGAVVRQIDRMLGPIDEAIGSIGSLVSKAGGLVGNIPGFASGTTGFAGGMALVGERGPELVRLPAGSSVIPNERIGGGGVVRLDDGQLRELARLVTQMARTA